MNRVDREDYTRQIDACARAKVDLHDALATLAEEATASARACLRKQGTPDLLAVSVAHRAVLAAEENYDIAILDLATARGADA